MDKLHNKLMKNEWYARFHKRRSHHVIQWLVLILVISAAALLIYNREVSNAPTYGLSSKAAQEAGKEDFSGITAQLLNYAHRFQKASPEEQANLRLGLVELAQQRRDLMLAALNTNPKAVARAAIPAGLLKQMPSEVANLIEKPATVEGTAEVMHTDFFDEGKAEYDYFVTGSNHIKYHLRTNNLLDRVVTGSKIKVTGVTLNDNLIPQDNSTGVIITAQASVTSTTQKKVAVIIVSFQDAPAVSTPDQIRAQMFTNPDSINKFYQENSFGKWELIGNLRPDGDVFGAYTIPYNNVDCGNFQKWSDAADSIAAKDGFSPTNYNTVVYQLDYTVGCFWSGKSTLGGTPARNWLDTEGFNIGVATHEMGHSFYLAHGSGLLCTDSAGNSVSLSSNCTYDEYNDPYDVMGAAPYRYHVNNYQKGQTGAYAPNSWIPTSSVVTLTSGQSGTYTLAPIETSTTGIQTIRIPRNYTVTTPEGYTYTTSPGYYYLEFRTSYGFDNFDAYPSLHVNGVLIRLAPDFNNANNSMLVDTTPETRSQYDAPLTVGKTYTDSFYGISITTQSISPAGAVVSITSTAAPCIAANPTLTVNPTTQSANSGTTLTYSYTLTNRDDSSCAASNFTVTPTLPSGWFQTPASFTETLAPGASVTRSFSITSATGAALASYNITQTAQNSGNSTYQAGATAQYVVTNIDTTPPTATITSPTSATAVKARSTITIAANATDNVGVTHVVFYISGTVLCDDSTAPYSCPWKVPGGKKVYDIIVRPYDAAGNVGYAHIAVQAK